MRLNPFAAMFPHFGPELAFETVQRDCTQAPPPLRLLVKNSGSFRLYIATKYPETPGIGGGSNSTEKICPEKFVLFLCSLAWWGNICSIVAAQGGAAS